MEYIEEILGKCKRDDKIAFIASIMAIIFFFSIEPIIIIYFSDLEYILLILFLGIIVMPIIGYMFGMKLGNMLTKDTRVSFNKTKLYKKIQKKGCLDEFINAINKEFNKKSAIKYFNDISGVGIFITETWFVFMSARNPKFVKTSQIVKISEEFSLEKSRYFLCLSLKDNTYISINGVRLVDIEKEIKAKYPNIEIGVTEK